MTRKSRHDAVLRPSESSDGFPAGHGNKQNKGLHGEEADGGIAEDYVLPKLMDLMRKGVSVPLFPKKLIGQMVCGYCLTPGVRDVEENMTRMVFGYQSDVLQGKRAAEHEFTVYDILRYLGPSVQSVLRRIDGDGCVGFVNALCVFDALDFGSLLSVEAVRMPGSGKLVLTGGIF